MALSGDAAPNQRSFIQETAMNQLNVERIQSGSPINSPRQMSKNRHPGKQDPGSGSGLSLRFAALAEVRRIWRSKLGIPAPQGSQSIPREAELTW